MRESGSTWEENFEKISEMKAGMLNVGTMTGKGRELAGMMQRKISILCAPDTRWKGRKARVLVEGYYRVDRRRNGVGVIVKDEV